MATSIKPEIYVAVKPIRGFIGIKPEVFVTIKVNGQAFIKPLIFATLKVEPKLESAIADTRKIIKRAESVSGDTARNIGISQTASGDTKKIIRHNEQAIGDTLKYIQIFQSATADTLKNLFIPAGAYFTPALFATLKFAEYQTSTSFDTLRRLAIPQSTQADTRINLGILQSVTADTLKRISVSQTVPADTLINVAGLQVACADSLLRIKSLDSTTADTLLSLQLSETVPADTLICKIERAYADTLKIITKTQSATADTVIRIPHNLRYVIAPAALHTLKAPLRNAPVSLINSFKDYGLTSFSVSLNETTLSDSFQIETVHPMDINDAVTGQFLDYNFNFLVEETRQQDLIQSVKGMYDVDKLLYSQIYSEGFITTSEILDGHLVQSNNEELTTYFYTAQDYINDFAVYLGLTPNIRIKDFTPYNVVSNSNVTYRDLLSNIFSWTKKLPQRQINVFIRGGTLHCIQRGLEDSVFDISELPHSRPNINKKLLRTLWNNPLSNNDSSAITSGKEPTVNDPLITYSDDEIAKPFSGNISFDDGGSSVYYRYSNGLLMTEGHTTSSSTVSASNRTTYSYDEVFSESVTELAKYMHHLVGDFYLTSKKTYGETTQITGEETITATTTTTNPSTGQASEHVRYAVIQNKRRVVTNSTTEYIYANRTSENIYLCEELEQTSSTTYELKHDDSTFTGTGGTVYEYWEQTDYKFNRRQTFHIPIGNGWYAQSVYVDGEPQGSTISQGKPGNKVTPYTVNQVQKSFTGLTITITENNSADNGGGSDPDTYEDWRNRLAPIADTSFPVRELELLKELTNDLLWLNRKIEETVSIDLISRIENGVPSINHVVDFTERIILDGKEYFLVSNQISFTPRKLIQKLNLIRWYAQ